MTKSIDLPETGKAALAHEASPPAAFAERLIQACCGSQSSGDAAVPAEDCLREAAASLYSLAENRPRGRSNIRVFQPSAADGDRGATVIEIVADDAPGLIDRVGAALRDMGIPIRFLARPVLSVRRDAAGRLVGVGGEEVSIRETFAHIEIDRLPDADAGRLEARVMELARPWRDRLRDALIGTHGEERGLQLMRRWGRSFPASYAEGTSISDALADIDRIEDLPDGISLLLGHSGDAAPAEARLKLYRAGDPVPLSDVLPLFEHMGFRVISEEPHVLRRPDDKPFIIHDFRVVSADGGAIDIDSLNGRLEEAFQACWNGLAEDDGFNRLIVRAGLTWRQVGLLRAYSRYLRQAGSTFTRAYVENSVASNGEVAALLVRLFEIRFNPLLPSDAPEILASIDKALESVVNADEDRILRRFLDLILCTLRTNYFQKDAAGRHKPYLALKLDSRRLQGLAPPRPMAEIFVYSPDTEGIHLRGGRVARGGIRWSDRPEDFRTEILGLMKAQMVKNAVIVPVGSKGGFVVRKSNPAAGREDRLAEAVACYRTFIGGLLDLTDNLAGGLIVPPPDTARRDGDDPYLVVAADKGTATFSDIANEVSRAYGFWLGDAFASGGSRGYDHKVMAITARGAWESVKRHFHEMGRDVSAEPFTVVGIGDMSGDVFGNGMLRSRAIRLVAAFDHRHIFLDPDPDPERSFEERVRLFALPRSSWADYDPGLLSPGGAIHSRQAKVIHLSPQVRERFSIETDILTPSELIRRLLLARVDLLWFGGIGTYVKAFDEGDPQVGDRANDGVRVNGRELSCKVVAEGANLAMTQRGRVEYALAGGRCNMDAIDNSAGVDCSDHEVNIKILLNAAVAEAHLSPDERDALLVRMTDEVAALVLSDNVLQTQAISVFEAQSAGMLDQQDRFMRLLERAGRLDRAVEFLPNDEELARRAHAGRGLTRPEIAVLLSYGKLWLYDAVLESGLPDDSSLLGDLVGYFPSALDTADWRRRMEAHRLRREIVATVVVNGLANRIGVSVVARLMEATGASADEVARAYLIVRDSFSLSDVWGRIEALDPAAVPAAVQTAMLAECNRLIGRGIDWVLGHASRPLDISRLRDELRPGVIALSRVFDSVLPADLAAQVAARAEEYRSHGVPEPLARRVAGLIVLASANDISAIARTAGRSVETAGRVYFLVGARFGLGWLRASAERLAGATHWQRLAADALIDDLYGRHAALAASVAALGGEAPDALAAWVAERAEAVGRVDQMMGELKATGTLDLAALTVASHRFGGLCGK